MGMNDKKIARTIRQYVAINRFENIPVSQQEQDLLQEFLSGKISQEDYVKKALSI